MEDLLTKVAARMTADLPEWARQYIENCIFFPQLGFLTVVPLDAETGKSLYEGEGAENDVWERMFCSEDMAYYKNTRMKEMDELFGDLYGMICGMSIFGRLPMHLCDSQHCHTILGGPQIMTDTSI